MQWGIFICGAARLGIAAFLLAACASGKPLPDPTNVNPSQPHPVGEQVYVNPGSGPLNAALGTAAAAGASAAQRTAGGCYSTCLPGTVCNPKTGLCDELPCRDRCTSEQYCDTTGPFPRCVSQKVDLKLDSLRQH
jgi:hypothetical protein